MRKTLCRPILAVALMAMLVVIGQAPRAYAAPLTPNSSCVSTYWQYNSDTTVNGWNNYKWELQMYMLRDSSSSVYCGKVYTRVGLIVPARSGVAWFHVWNEYYRNNAYIGETSSFFTNIPQCCTSGPYWVKGNAYSAPSGSAIEIIGDAENDTGGHPAGTGYTTFYAY